MSGWAGKGKAKGKKGKKGKGKGKFRDIDDDDLMANEIIQIPNCAPLLFVPPGIMTAPTSATIAGPTFRHGRTLVQ